MTVIAGVDGCRGGWLCVLRNGNDGLVQATVLERIGDLLTLCPRPDLVLIDMPIGLPDAGPRECDRQARRLLQPPRSSSVFSAPIRPALHARSYQEACAIGSRIDGRKLTKQLWGIVPKIRELDSFLGGKAARAGWIREFHPEVSFWAWNGQKAMTHRKKSAAGRAEREALIQTYAGTGFKAARSQLPRRHCQIDDLLDAFAGLWSAERVVTGRALVLPVGAPVFDSRGLRMEIVV
ncbi:MAG: DUF429 domain-containing protein [Gemmataceae bacterium]|nr:DUF429 domain-containing protein [Gemmataceae bacterium]